MAENQEAVVVEATNTEAPKARRSEGKGKDGKKFERRPRPARREKEYQERVVTIKRVSKTVKGGRRARFSALVVIGDGKGTVGYGLGKANEVPDAIKKALDDARKNLYKVPMVKPDTIPHATWGEFGSSRVYLRPAPEGTGVVAGGPVRAVLELAGIRNICSKIYGSRISLNVVKATVNGIANSATVAKVARLRGKSVKELLEK